MKLFVFDMLYTAESTRAASELRTLILNGAYDIGDRLPPERELVKLLGVSRTTLRKGLDTLEREGEIWRRVGKGTFVDKKDEMKSETDLPTMLRKLTPISIMRARMTFEPAIAGEAAMNASPEAIINLKRAERCTAASTSWKEYEANDDRFHRTIAAATENPLLLSLFNQMNQIRRAVAWGNLIRETHRPESKHSSYAEHSRIANAIMARDVGEAQTAMRVHIASVSARLFGEQ